MAVFLNDRFTDNAGAFLHVTDLSIQRGYGVFDFLRTVNGVPLFLNDHLQRFYNSAAYLHLPVKFNIQELSSIIHELIQRSGVAEAGVRITLTGGYSTDSYHPAEPNLIITCNPVTTITDEEFEKGYSIITHHYQRELPHVKSINYLMAVWLLPLLKEKKADDLLYYNDESVTEFPRCNVFIVTSANRLVTPAKNILHGITRKNVLALATDVLPVEERDITLDELMNASEVFLTATTKNILPVLKINDHVVGDGHPGKITRELYKKFRQLENSLVHLVSR
jgi:D-alanine transaminase/branched-chain amino acid aminotransferase